MFFLNKLVWENSLMTIFNIHKLIAGKQPLSNDWGSNKGNIIKLDTANL